MHGRRSSRNRWKRRKRGEGTRAVPPLVRRDRAIRLFPRKRKGRAEDAATRGGQPKIVGQVMTRAENARL